MDNTVLLQKLTEKGVLSRQQSSKLIEESQFLSKPIDEIIQDRRLADPAQVAQVKGEIINVPFRQVEAGEITDEILALIPAETALNYKVLPLGKEGDMLIVGMVYPDDPRGQDALRFIAKKMSVSLGVYIISISDFQVVARKYSPFQSEIEAAVQSLSQKYGKEGARLASGQKIVQIDEGVSVSEEAPIIKIVSKTLQEAVDRKASDIHVEPQRSRLRIRFRINGDLEEVSSLPLELHQPVVSRIKILAELKIDEARIPQDGRFRTVLAGRDIDFRVATFPTPVGEKVVLRILDPTTGLKGLSDLGLSEYNTKIIEEGIAKPFGMILISGPTGSGKTTTLYAILQLLNKIGVNIVSLEDPVEYFMDGLNQSQVRPEIGYNFAAGLRQILRQDPDVIMVGEIRDNETAELAVHAALTGHIVLSTIHTNNAISVLPRLVDMGVQRFLLPAALNLMAGQRLVGRLCDKCKQSYQASGDLEQMIEKGLELATANLKEKYKKPFTVYKAVGCDECKGKGTVGRVALFEILKMTTQLSDLLVEEEISESKALAEAKRQGMINLRLDGILKALGGSVAIEDVLRETEE